MFVSAQIKRSSPPGQASPTLGPSVSHYVTSTYPTCAGLPPPPPPAPRNRRGNIGPGVSRPPRGAKDGVVLEISACVRLGPSGGSPPPPLQAHRVLLPARAPARGRSLAGLSARRTRRCPGRWRRTTPAGPGLSDGAGHVRVRSFDQRPPSAVRIFVPSGPSHPGLTNAVTGRPPVRRHGPVRVDPWRAGHRLNVPHDHGPPPRGGPPNFAGWRATNVRPGRGFCFWCRDCTSRLAVG